MQLLEHAVEDPSGRSGVIIGVFGRFNPLFSDRRGSVVMK